MENRSELDVLDVARNRLVESGGRVSQDLGAGRIIGRILIFLYLQEKECSLDTISAQLEVSKASVSIAVRQLEQFGAVVQICKEGDRKNYYRSADNIASALQDGLLTLVQEKLELFSMDLDNVMQMLDAEQAGSESQASDYLFLQKRLSRALQLQRRLQKIINHPVVRYLATK
jgi:DNA-binding transcriptional regulator GbsR (MarR family)